jgi:hypothetical protein
MKQKPQASRKLQTNRRKPDPDWAAIRMAYEASAMSIRALARERGLSDVAISKRAKAEGWTRKPKPPGEPIPSPAAAELKVSPKLAAVVDVDPKMLIKHGRDLTRRLMDELDATTSHVGEIEEAIAAYTADDKDGQRRFAMLKAVGLPTRANVLKTLALAAKTLAEAAPGKKEEAKEAAATAAKSGRFAMQPTPPKLVVDNEGDQRLR